MKKWLFCLLFLFLLLPSVAMAAPNLNITSDMTGAAYMAQMNTNLQAIDQWFYGSTDPASYTPSQAYPGAWWTDTGNNLVKQRNAANSAWVTKGIVLSDGTVQWGYSAATALTPGSTVAVDFSQGSVFTLTPGQTETLTASNGMNGQIATLIITTSGTTSYTLTFSTNFKAAGTLATGTVSAKVFTITFRYNGSTWYEIGRTTAM